LFSIIPGVAQLLNTYHTPTQPFLALHPRDCRAFPTSHPLYPELTEALAREATARHRLAAARAALEAALRVTGENGAHAETARGVLAAARAQAQAVRGNRSCGGRVIHFCFKFLTLCCTQKNQRKKKKKTPRNRQAAARLAHAEAEVHAAETALAHARAVETDVGARSTAAEASVTAKRASVAAAETDAAAKRAAAARALADLEAATRELEQLGHGVSGHREHTRVAEARVVWRTAAKAEVSSRVRLHDASAKLAAAQAAHASAQAALAEAKAATVAAQAALDAAIAHGDAAVAAAQAALASAQAAYATKDAELHTLYESLTALYARTTQLRRGVSWFHHFYTYYAYYTIKLEHPKAHYCDIADGHAEQAKDPHGKPVHPHTRQFFRDACDRYDIHIEYEPLIAKHKRDYYYSAWSKYYAAHGKSREAYIAKHGIYATLNAEVARLKRAKDAAAAALAAAKTERDRAVAQARAAHAAAHAAEQARQAAATQAAAALGHASAEHTKAAADAAAAYTAADAAKQAFDDLLGKCIASEHCRRAHEEIEAKFASKTAA
jgi:hypothetical protein